MVRSADTPSWYRRFAAADGADTGALCKVLADERRRAILGVLGRADGELTDTGLAELVASAEADTAPGELSSRTLERVLVSLHHSHLPQLEANGLVERGDGNTVRRTQHPFWRDSALHVFLAYPDLAPDTVTATLEVLTNRVTRATLAVLRDRGETTLERLASELSGSPVADQGTTRVLIGLVHRHLPKLATAGVIEFDSRNGRVSYTGNPVLEEWFGAVREVEVESP